MVNICTIFWLLEMCLVGNYMQEEFIYIRHQCLQSSDEAYCPNKGRPETTSLISTLLTPSGSRDMDYELVLGKHRCVKH